MPEPATHPETTYLTGPQVCARYNIVQMTLWRWLRDPELGFPQPAMRVKDRRRWREEDLIAWERSSAPRRHRAEARLAT